jgi:O-antigen/teichoic acid export membrane protein
MPEPTNGRALIETLIDTAHRRNGGQVSGEFSGDARGPDRSFRRALAMDAFNYFSSKVVPSVMGFLSVLVFVRMVGVEQYGHYAVVFSFVTACASGLAGWLSQGILRFQSQWCEPGDSLSFLRSAAAGTVLSVAIGAIAVGIAMPALGVQKGWSLLISLAFLSALIVYTVALARFQASLRSGRVLRFEAVRSLSCFAIPATLLWLTRSRDYRLLLLGIALGYWLPMAGLILSRAKAHKDAGLFQPSRLSSGQRRILAEVWRYGWPVALWMGCQQGLVVSDRFFLQKFIGYSGAGVYASMYDIIVRSFSLLFMPVTLAVHPLVMNRWNAGYRKNALQAIRSGVKYQILMFIPFAMALAAFAPWITRCVLGKASSGATQLLLPLAIGGFLWQVCLLAHKPLEILCQTKRMLLGIAASLALNVAGNWLLVPRYGYRASAYLTVASASAYLIMLFALTPGRELRGAGASVAPSTRAEVNARARVDFLETS